MFQGLGVAMVTPFLQNGDVDVNGLKKLTQHLVENGTDTLVVMGTTGESATLSHDEKVLALETVKEVNNGKKKIVLGVGGNNTTEVCKTFGKFDLNGVDGILSVSPYYNKPTASGLIAHFTAVSESTELPIILYNVPGRTGSNMPADVSLQLANDLKNVVAIKEACGDLEQIMYLINQAPSGFEVISGDDALTLPIIAAGGTGVISVVGNAFPKEFSQMIQAALKGDLVEARKKHYQLFDLIPMLFAEGNPAGVKEILKTIGVCDANVRLPLTPISEGLNQKIKKYIAQVGLV